MFDWITNLFARGYSGLTDLANDIRRAIANLANLFVGQFVAWVAAGVNLWNAVGNFSYGLVAMLLSMLGFVRRVALVYIPNATASAVNQAFTWTEKRIADAVRYTEQRVAEVTAWAAQAFNDLRTWATGQVAAILSYIHNIATLLNDVAKRVYALLTNPRALADWVAGELIGAIWRWATGNADALARLALGMAVSGALKLAGVLERVISDVFL